MKATTSKALTIALKISLIILIPVIVFFSAYTFFMYKYCCAYKTKLASYVTTINQINRTITLCENKDNSMNIELSKANLPGKVGSLIKIKQNLSNINPTNKYNKLNEDIILGLEYNIDIYRTILSSINNNASESNIESIKKYKDSCVNQYKDTDLKNMGLSFPKQTTLYINNFIKYETQQIKLSK